MRAVRRQISLNRHRRSMLKHYNIDSAMVMAMEQKDLTVEDGFWTPAQKGGYLIISLHQMP